MTTALHIDPATVYSLRSLREALGRTVYHRMLRHLRRLSRDWALGSDVLAALDAAALDKPRARAKRRAVSPGTQAERKEGSNATIPSSRQLRVRYVG